MSLFPIAILIVVAAFSLSIHHLNQTAQDYFDLVALLFVVCGTFAVGLVSLPWQFKRELRQSFKKLFLGHKTSFKHCLKVSLAYIQAPSLEASKLKNDFLYQKVLKDGFELKSLNISAEKIEMILNERISSYVNRQKKISNALKGLAKYPPAFGLMGTVIGLVNVMTGVSTGSDAKTTALKMAIALVATMYGLVMANLFVNPAGELIHKYAQEDETLGLIAVEAVLLEMNRTSLLEAQEYLNSFAPEADQINVINNFEEEKVA